MALLSDLVTICADHGLDTVPTLSQFARELREAGRVSKAGRGRGAARMTYLDASRFLIACAGTDHPKRAADAEAVFSELMLEDGLTPQAGWDLPGNVALDTALAAMLEAVGSGYLDSLAREDAEKRAAAEGRSIVAVFGPMPELRLDRSGAWAELSVFGASHRWLFRDAAMIALMDSIDALEGHERATQLIAAAEQQALRFRTGKNLQARLEPRLLRAVADAVAGNNVNAERQSTFNAPGAGAPGQTEDVA